jgi:mono/diheme cytochrome c family protein/DNA-binding beta-propeller fold protein YncE
VLVAVGATWLAACGAGSDAASEGGGAGTSRSSTIALDATGGSLWLTSPDDDRIVAVDPTSLEVRREVEVEGQPQELAWSGDLLVVTGAQRTSLAVVPTGGAGDGGAGAVGAIEVPCGGTRGVVTVPRPMGDGRALALATCPTDDLVAVVDLDAGRSLAALAVAGRPTGIVRDGGRLTVTTLGDGRLLTWDLARLVDELPRPSADGETVPVLDLEPDATAEAWADGERSASLLAAVDAGPRGPVGAYQVVDHVRKLSSAQLRGDPTYGTPLNGRARLEAAVAGECGARFSDVGDPAQHLSGPVALAADPGSDLVWVVGQFSRSVSVVRCDGGGPGSRTPTVASFAVGDGPRGIALAADGRAAFVDVGFDHEVARLELPDGLDDDDAPLATERLDPAAVGRRSVDGALSPLAQAGRSMFHDGTDEHLTPFGVVTCASCHPGAGDDGLSWRIETAQIDRKLRRTPALWQLDDEAKLLHWNGEFTSTDDLVLSTIQELLGGDALLIDTAAIEAYLAEVPPPPAPTLALTERSAVAEGRELFESEALGCADCHAGELGTDGNLHDVLAPSSEQAAQLDAAVTPPLAGVRGRAPFGHDGRAPTLADLLAQHEDGDGERLPLDDEQIDALVAYLRSR